MVEEGAPVNEHVRQQWRQAVTVRSTRFTHFVLPDDPLEAHALVTSFGQPRSRTAAEINPPPTSDFDKNRFHDLVGKGGFSSHPWRDSPSKGYMASLDTDIAPGVVHHINDLTPDHIGQHRESIRKHLLKPGVFQGGWHDRSTGDVYLDTSRHFQSEPNARKFALAHRQKAYYVLHSGQEMFLDPHRDPQFHEDRDGWHKKYDHIVRNHGTEPPEQYKSYAHLFPLSEEEQKRSQAVLTRLAHNDALARRAGMRHGVFD